MDLVDDRHEHAVLDLERTDVRAPFDAIVVTAAPGHVPEPLKEQLAPGGRLLYVTCSVLAQENEEVIGRFLKANAEAAEDRVLHDYNIRDLMCDRRHGFQVLPGTKGLDGFYFACLEKARQ